MHDHHLAVLVAAGSVACKGQVVGNAFRLERLCAYCVCAKPGLQWISEQKRRKLLKQDVGMKSRRK